MSVYYVLEISLGSCSNRVERGASLRELLSNAKIGSGTSFKILAIHLEVALLLIIFDHT